jgi:hypothetical protein
MKTQLIFDANGNPFHLPETQIYEEPDGTLTYDCPHCKAAEYVHCLWHDVTIRTGEEYLPAPQLRRRLELLAR